jgi:hypothetical protein
MLKRTLATGLLLTLALVVVPAHAQSVAGTLNLAQQGVGCGPAFPALTCRVPVLMQISGQATTQTIYVQFQLFNASAKAWVTGVDGIVMPAVVQNYHWSGGDVQMEIAGVGNLTGSADDDAYDIIFDAHYSLSKACSRCNYVAQLTSFIGTFNILN